MQVQAGDDGHVGSDPFTHAPQQLAFAVVQVLGHHRAVQIKVDPVQRHRGRQPLQDQRADALVGVARDRSRRTGRGPGGGQQRMRAHRLDEAGHRYVGAGHRLEHGRPADQPRPAAALVREILPRRARRRERVRLMLKAAYPDTHQNPLVIRMSGRRGHYAVLIPARVSVLVTLALRHPQCCKRAQCHYLEIVSLFGKAAPSGVARSRLCRSVATPPGEARKRFGDPHPATGIVNSAPLPMLSGQRCITLL